MRERRIGAKRKGRGREKKERQEEERKQRREERTSCMCRTRVEFYACLIWKWIVRECASMSRVVKIPVGETERDRERREAREKETGER